ncbi:hypothetical protein [Wolbachia endosymbiont (group A) of Trypoxylon clavicerum]|nr:hypothetical protein [Wolbachia endosymbiont (group A) of Trypoxylon clavicerum]
MASLKFCPQSLASFSRSLREFKEKAYGFMYRPAANQAIKKRKGG